MERKWKLADWKGTKIKEAWETTLPMAEIKSLRAKRHANNKRLDRHPYDPVLWVKRAYTHAKLRYPELAVGDAWKAEILCKSLLSDLKQNLKPNFRIGANAGFWMRQDDPEDEYDEVPPWLNTVDLDVEHLKQEKTFELVLSDAEQVKRDNLEFAPNSEEGRFVPQAYPWMHTQHSMRMDKTLDEINAALADPPPPDLPCADPPCADSPIDEIDAALARTSLHEIIAALANTSFHRVEPAPAEAAFDETNAALTSSTIDETNAALADPSLDETEWHRPAKPKVPRPTGMMVVKRYAFGTGVGARDGADLLGAFALRDIKGGELVLVDESKTWGCTGPGKEDARLTDMDGLPACGKAINLGGGYGCPNFMHPNQKHDVVEHDLRWVRDRLGVDAAHAILCARSYLNCVQDQVDHPLSHTLIARLTPNYTKDAIKHFSLERQIRVINEALQQFGIDIFANRNYDTWVLFEVESRLSNNAWSDAIVDCLSPLFCMINHSCEPNLIWRTQGDHQTLKIKAKKDIKKGEQLFIEYDQYQHSEPLEVRRRRLENWFGHDCQCTRCMREEAEEQAEIRKILKKEGLGHINKIVDGSGLTLEALGKAWDTSEPVELPEDCIIGGKWAQIDEAAAEKKKKRRAHKKKAAGTS